MRNRIIGWTATVIALLVTIVALAAPAAARQDGAESVVGKVFNEKLVEDRTTRDPVPGVAIRVTTPDGAVVGEAVTDADGTYTIALPGPGDYVLSIDPDSLPDGVAAKAGDEQRTVSVAPGQQLIGNFFLGEDTRKVESRWSRLPQSLFDGLFFGLIIAIASVGLSLIYGTTGLSNFAHGEMVTFGAVMAWVFNRTFGVPLILATVLAVICGVAVGFLFDKAVWAQLRRRRIGLTSQMIASIGLALFFRYLIQYLFGPKTESYGEFQNQTDPIDLGVVEFPPRVLVTIVISLVALGGVAVFLLRTRFGKAVRAVSDNPDLASATGINTNRIIAVVWALGGGLAALGGVLVGLDQKVSWDRGAAILLLMFAAITLGGLGSAFGALVGSLVIGLAVELSAWLFPDYIDLKRTGALIVLILVLLIRPQGILGQRERVG